MKHRTGAQSFDLHSDGNLILVSDAMNILHLIERDRLGEMTGKTIDKGIMGILYARFVPNSKTIFTSKARTDLYTNINFLLVNFAHGLQTFDLEGENISRFPYEKVKNVSSVNFVGFFVSSLLIRIIFRVLKESTWLWEWILEQ